MWPQFPQLHCSPNMSKCKWHTSALDWEWVNYIILYIYDICTSTISIYCIIWFLLHIIYVSLNLLVDVSENQHLLNGKVCRCWIAFVKGSTNKFAYFPIQASGQEAEIHTMLLHAANVIKRYKGNTCCWICHHSSCPHGGCSMCGMALGCRPIGLGNVHSGAGLWPSAGPSVLWRIEIISLQITSGEVEGTKSLWKKRNDSVPDCTKLYLYRYPPHD